jgi:hypothetical protein
MIFGCSIDIVRFRTKRHGVFIMLNMWDMIRGTVQDIPQCAVVTIHLLTLGRKVFYDTWRHQHCDVFLEFVKSLHDRNSKFSRWKVISRLIKNAVFWDVTQCGYYKKRSFGATYRHDFQGDKNRRTRNVSSMLVAANFPSLPILLILMM